MPSFLLPDPVIDPSTRIRRKLSIGQPKLPLVSMTPTPSQLISFCIFWNIFDAKYNFNIILLFYLKIKFINILKASR